MIVCKGPMRTILMRLLPFRVELPHEDGIISKGPWRSKAFCFLQAPKAARPSKGGQA